MVCRVAALPWTSPSPSWRSSWAKRSHVRNEAPQHLDDQLQAAAETPDDIAPRLDQFARVRCRCRRARRRSAEMTEQAKHQALLVDRLRHMVVHAAARQASRVGQRGVGGHGRSAARRSARRRGFSGRLETIDIRHLHVHQHRVERSPPAPAERPPARRRRGPPGALAAQQLGGDGGSARCPPPADARPATAGCAPPGAAAGWPRRPRRRAAHAARVGQLLGRDRLGEIDEGRRAVVARIGQHLAAIGGDHDHHGRRQVALQLADQLRRAGEPSRSGMRQSISTTS